VIMPLLCLNGFGQNTDDDVVQGLTDELVYLEKVYDAATNYIDNLETEIAISKQIGKLDKLILSNTIESHKIDLKLGKIANSKRTVRAVVISVLSTIGAIIGGKYLFSK